MNASRRRLFWIVLTALAAGALLVAAFWPRPLPVDLVRVERGPMMVTIDEEGESRVKDVYVVSAPIAGRTRRIDAEVGDKVVAGETVVATIQETRPAFLDERARSQAEAEVKAAEAAHELAKAEVERAEAELEFSRRDLERAERLAPSHAIAERALDRAGIDVRIRQAELATARANLEVRAFELLTARAALIGPGLTDGASRPEEPQSDVLTIRAPISGTILQLHQKSAAVVGAGAPLLEIGDPKNLEAVVDLLSQDAVKVRPGAAVLIEDWGGGEVLDGTVRRIEPFGFTKTSALGIDEQRVNVIIDFSNTAAAGKVLGHGYRIRTRIVAWQADDALKLPLGALFRHGQDWAVFLNRDGKAVLAKVQLGQRNDEQAEILSGLEAGDQVITHPSDQIEEGVAITAREVEALG